MQDLDIEVLILDLRSDIFNTINTTTTNTKQGVDCEDDTLADL